MKLPFTPRTWLTTAALCFSFMWVVVAQNAPAPASAPPAANVTATAAFAVNITVDAAQALAPWRPVWRFFGADEPNYATMKDGQKLLGELGALDPRQVYFRAHNLLTTGDGTPAYKWGSTNAYTEDVMGNPVYNWTILDQIFDAYIQHGVRPYVEIGFMPKALSIHPDPYQHNFTPTGKASIFTGWSYPPKDYAKWGELVYQWAKHCVDRYGAAEVEKWYWETWNEPNIGYWHGTPADFQKLHDYAIAGVRRALPTARVGGPDMAGSSAAYLRGFIEHCLSGQNNATGQTGTPLDFLSFHAKGSPTVFQNHVRLGISNQLGSIDSAFHTVSAYPELKNTPLVIGESDPDGCAACEGPQLAYRNTSQYPAYTIACIARELDLAARYGVNFEGALTWAFEFEGQSYFAGQRTLATNGTDLPVLNAFRALSQMGGTRVAANSSAQIALNDIVRSGVRGAPDVGALASLAPGKLCVLVWHYHDDDVPGPDAAVDLAIAHLPAAAIHPRLEHYRIDQTHSNSFTAWKNLGSPASPTPEQLTQLDKAGQLERLADPVTVAVNANTATLHFTLPRQGISLLVFTWDEPAAPAAAAPAAK